MTRRNASPDRRLAETALKLLAKKSWAEITLTSVAKAAKVPIAELALFAPAKPALIASVLRLLGGETTKRYKPARDSSSPRDRLFDVCMTWFDVLGSRKPAIRSLYRGLRSDPLALLSVRDALVSAAEWLMTLAEADQGPALRLRAITLAAILGRAIPIWLEDDSDLTNTMARLDGDLRRGESVWGRL